MIMNGKDKRKTIETGKTVLGIEFGSTRIKAVLIGEDYMPFASGSQVSLQRGAPNVHRQWSIVQLFGDERKSAIMKIKLPTKAFRWEVQRWRERVKTSSAPLGWPN
jgi:hypothetical protein